MTASAEPLDLEGRILIELDGLYIANADGTDRQLVYEQGEYCCVNRISPDRTRILVMPGTDDTGAVRGGTLSLDGSEFELLPRPDETLNLVPSAWSPDGKRIAFEGWDDSDPSRNGIYSARASDLSDLVRITDRPGLPHDSPLDYSPDGTQLVFFRAVRAEPDFPIDLGGSLWVVNVDGTDAHELQTGDVRPSWNARWSPDGSTIVFAEERLRQPERSGRFGPTAPTSRWSSRILTAGSLGPRSGLPTGARSCSTSTRRVTTSSTTRTRSTSSTPTAPD